ncbi:MAB_1171c family putative transporter [Nocardia sp. NPDC052566]|uniref:MAB_1171c family putative transporter n=1 Tax=Nocardia sp. NPDC052566 TaxID=3364330 RepID=UPI0037CC402D
MTNLVGLETAGRNAEVGAALLMWAVTVVRLPGVIRRPKHRQLWLAIAAAAVAFSFDLSLFAEFCTTLAGSWTRLVGDLFGLLAAAAILGFSMTAAGFGRLTSVMWTVTAADAVFLATIDVAFLPRRAAAEIYDYRGLSAGALYLVAIAGAHIAACTSCAIICWIRGWREAHGALRASLLMFGTGATLLCFGWAANVLYFATLYRPFHLLSPLLVGLGGAGYAMATQVPFVQRGWRNLKDIGTLWRLWPLWRRLVAVTPEATMAPMTSPFGGLMYFVREPGIGVHRILIELRDSLLYLRGYVSSETIAMAESVPPVARFPDDHALRTACWIRVALRAKVSGEIPVRREKPSTRGRAGDFVDEVAFFSDLRDSLDSWEAIDFENDCTGALLAAAA